MSLHDDQPLDQKEQGALARSLMLPEHERKEWWAGLPDNTRKAIMQKLLGALAKAESPRDIGTLTRSLIAADKLDLEREKIARGIAGGTVNNTQVNINGGPAEMFRELIREVHDARATDLAPAAEPVGDDQR